MCETDRLALLARAVSEHSVFATVHRPSRSSSSSIQLRVTGDQNEHEVVAARFLYKFFLVPRQSASVLSSLSCTLNTVVHAN